MVGRSRAAGSAKRLAQLEPPDQIQLNAPSWSPDGKTILIGVQSLRDGPHNAAFAVDVATGAARNLGGRWAFVHDLEWMPDGGSFIVSASEFGGQTPQVWQVMFPGGERHRITNDLNSYVGVSVAKDGHSLATVQVENSSNIWISPARRPGGRASRSPPVKVAATAWPGSAGRRMAESSSHRIVSGHPEIWVMDADGQNQRQLTNSPQPSLVPSATRDGRYVVYQKVLADGMYLYRVGLDGSNAMQLTKGGAEFQPTVSPRRPVGVLQLADVRTAAAVPSLDQWRRGRVTRRGLFPPRGRVVRRYDDRRPELGRDGTPFAPRSDAGCGRRPVAPAFRGQLRRHLVAGRPQRHLSRHPATSSQPVVARAAGRHTTPVDAAAAGQRLRRRLVARRQGARRRRAAPARATSSSSLPSVPHLDLDR